MFFDGSLMKTGAGAGLLFISPLGKHLCYVLRLHFPVSNNVAEYEALVNGLRIAIELGVRRLDARHRPSHEELPLPRPEDGGLLR
jgi:ribonuclease HI